MIIRIHRLKLNWTISRILNIYSVLEYKFRAFSLGCLRWNVKDRSLTLYLTLLKTQLWFK